MTVNYNFLHFKDEVAGLIALYTAMKYSYATELGTILTAVGSDVRANDQTISGQPANLTYLPSTGVTGVGRSPFYTQMIRLIEKGLAEDLTQNQIAAAINDSQAAVTIPAPIYDIHISSNATPPIQGSVLSATGVAGEWDGTPTSFTYQWQRERADIGGATSATYTLQAGDTGGKRIRCNVKGVNATGTSPAYASNEMYVA